jgi:hypothetical protein
LSQEAIAVTSGAATIAAMLLTAPLCVSIHRTVMEILSLRN